MEISEIFYYVKDFLSSSALLFVSTNLPNRASIYMQELKGTTIRLASTDVPKFLKSVVEAKSESMMTTFTNMIIFIAMILALFYMLFSIIRSSSDENESSSPSLFQSDNTSGSLSLLSSGRSAKTKEASSTVKFSDVAGLEEEKKDVQIFVDIMKNREKYLNMGAKLPKGFLMVGPPGCGKTLLAKAIAGESGVNFIAASGSEFIEMYVGVGASRVRNLFKKAREMAPCIVFIDEIDSVGGKRGNIDHQEHTQTLNNLLTEIDGFNARDQILCIGATNRLDMLDDALVRSGRFDKHINVDLPSLVDRESIFKLYLNKLKLDKTMNVGGNADMIETYAKDLAKNTPGVSGADIENICNQAAIKAVDCNSEVITLEHLRMAVEDVCIGGQKKSRKVNEHEKKIVAYHESGHAIIGYVLQNTGAPQIISCIPRGAGNLGYTMPHQEDIMLRSRIKMIEEISALLGGTVAEDIFFNGDVTSGASNDIERATGIAYSMCTQYGMSKKIGKIQMGMKTHNSASGGPQLSGETMAKVDNVVKRLMDDIYVATKEIMLKHRKYVEIIAEYLLVNEEIRKEKIEELLGKDIYKSMTLSTIEVQ
jgi:ATP-dependent metalloprotease FtsH